MSHRTHRRRETAGETAGRPPRRRRLFWTGCFFLATLAAAAWFAPTIVARTSLRDRILPTMFPDAKADFTIGSASLGWLAPVELFDVEARDPNGGKLFHLEHFQTQRTLWQLVQDQTHLGALSIHGLTVYANMRDDGSNLEDAFAPLLVAGEETPPRRFEVAIAESTIELHDAVAQRQSQINNVRADVILTPDAEKPLQARFSGDIVDQSLSGNVLVEYSQSAPAAGNGGATDHEIHLQGEQTPLRPLACLLRRSIGPCDVAGSLTNDLRVQFSGAESPTIRVWGRLDCSNLKLSAAQWLGEDVFQSSLASYTGNVIVQPDRVIAEGARLQLDHGRIEIDGSIPRSAAGGSLRDALLMLANEDLHARGEIDLAKLARALPDTLRIREDTTITGGKIAFDFAGRSTTQPSQPQQPQRVWSVQLTAANITAESAGRAIVWEQPITLQAAARRSANGFVVDQLNCQSDFLQIVGQGDLNNASLAARADLTALAEQLGQFVDLRNVALAGTADFGVRLLRQGQSDQIGVEGSGEVHNLRVAAGGTTTLDEKLLLLGLSGTLVGHENMTQIGARDARLTLTAGDDTLSAALRGPIGDLVNTPVWPLRVEGNGNVNTWAARLGWLLPLAGWRVEGELALTANAELAPGEVRLLAAQCDVTNLVASGHGRHLREQQAQLTVAGVWSPSERRFEAKLTTLATTSWSLRGDEFVLQLQEGGSPRVQGRLAFRSDIRRTLASLRAPREPLTTPVRGMATGNVAIASAEGVTTLDFVAQIENLVIESKAAAPAAGGLAARPIAAIQATSTLWTERQLKTSGRLVYQHADDRLQAPALKVEAAGATLACTGEVTALTTAPLAAISGAADYNLAVLMQRLRPILGQDVQLVGADTATFSLRGPLFPSMTQPISSTRGDTRNAQPAAPASLISPELQASAEISWQSAQLYGLPLGAGDLHGQLRRGILDFEPLSMSVSEGTLHIAPRFYFNEQPAVMTIDRGQVLDNVQLTPEICHTWLKFVAPLLADATECQGRISAQVDRAVFPLAAPPAGALAGTLTIHEAEVRPGPMASGYINLVQRIQGVLQGRPPESDVLADPIRLVKLDEQQLNVNMTGGRIYHQGLTMKIGDVAVVTSGSVGADQSLDLIAEVAVQDSWIEGRKYFAGLQGKTLKVPIRGNVSHPHVDFSVLEELGRMTLGGSAQRIFRQEINNLLGDLLDPQRQRSGDGQLQPPQLTPPTLTPPTQTPPTLTPPQVELPGGPR